MREKVEQALVKNQCWTLELEDAVGLIRELDAENIMLHLKLRRMKKRIQLKRLRALEFLKRG